MMENCPFADPAIKRALAGSIFLIASGVPLGMMLVLRRMSLIGDVIAHAILPGTAAGFILAGMSISAMSIGGLTAGLLVALLAGIASRYTVIREDANLVAVYLLAVALGVIMLTLHGTSQNLEDILFGNAASIEKDMLIAMGVVSSLTLIILAIIWRPLVIESFDPIFMQSVRGRGGFYHVLFMMLVVLNMIEGFRMLGTLMAAGLMIIPAVTAQLWARNLSAQIGVAMVIGLLSSVAGLWLTYASRVPSGPAIILIAGGIYVLSLLVGRRGSVRARYFPFRHLES